MAVGLSALRAGRPLPARRFLVLISFRGWVDDPRDILRLVGLGQLKKSNDLIGNRIRDHPVCSTVPQPTTLPRTPSHKCYLRKFSSFLTENNSSAKANTLMLFGKLITAYWYKTQDTSRLQIFCRHIKASDASVPYLLVYTEKILRPKRY
jgi:hypothetical protein